MSKLKSSFPLQSINKSHNIVWINTFTCAYLFSFALDISEGLIRDDKNDIVLTLFWKILFGMNSEVVLHLILLLNYVWTEESCILLKNCTIISWCSITKTLSFSFIWSQLIDLITVFLKASSFLLIVIFSWKKCHFSFQDEFFQLSDF